VAEFTSNKLEYLTSKLCTKYKKLLHGKYPGQVLWNECEKRNKEAWEEMKKYNIHDVLSTEELYLKLQGWAPESMPKLFINDSKAKKRVCGVCGSYSVQGWGVRFANHAKYQRLRCNECGHFQKGEKIA
jgi:hypothetical protein